MAKLVAHRQITTIAEIRKGLVFPDPVRFREDVASLDSPSPFALGSVRTLGLKRGPSVPGSTSTSASKRKSASDHTSTDASGSKRRRSSSFKSKLAADVKDVIPKPSLYTPSEDPWENRIYSCLVVSPAGRVISDFNSIKELLEAMRDAIRAHQSLYTTSKILHRDISSNNIIIPDSKTDSSSDSDSDSISNSDSVSDADLDADSKEDAFKGMLIDLDLAKVLDSSPSGARHQTGTMQFMAIQVLLTADHTYRHDLESFFYVLIWMCARKAWEKKQFISPGERRPKESLLRKWEIGSFREFARTKAGDMTRGGIDMILDEFPVKVDDVVRPLCLNIRKILFPLDQEEKLNFGTPAGDPDQLYKSIIAAYNAALNKL